MQPLVKLIDLKQNLGKNKLKLIWCSMPEILLITETCFYWYYTSLWNPVAIILLVVLLSVFFFQKQFLNFGSVNSLFYSEYADVPCFVVGIERFNRGDRYRPKDVNCWRDHASNRTHRFGFLIN